MPPQNDIIHELAFFIVNTYLEKEEKEFQMQREYEVARANEREREREEFKKLRDQNEELSERIYSSNCGRIQDY